MAATPSRGPLHVLTLELPTAFSDDDDAPDAAAKRTDPPPGSPADPPAGVATPSPDFPSLVRAVADAERAVRDDDATRCEPAQADTETTDPVDALAAARTALWRAAFTLPGWLLVATDLQDTLRPHVRHEGDRAMVLAFTDEFIALRRQAESGMTFREGFSSFSVSLDTALELIDSLGEGGATEVLFNDGQEAFGAPIGSLRRIRRHLEHGDDPEALATTIVQVVGDPQPIGPLLAAAGRDDESRRVALDALMKLTDWWFVCNPQQPDAFHVRRFAVGRDGGTMQVQAVVAFTSHRLALESTDRYGLADDDGSIVLMQMPVTDAIGWLQSFREHGVETVMFDPLTTPLPLAIADLPGEWERRKSTCEKAS